jgi:hypothetical protein
MLLSIPYQALEIGCVHVSPFQIDDYGRNLARLTYKDTSIDFQDVSILSPPLRVVRYNAVKNQLTFDVREHGAFMTKLSVFQEHLVNTFAIHQESLLRTNGIYAEDIHNLFQFLLNGTLLTVFIYPSTIVRKPDGNDVFTHSLQEGDRVRILLRIYGITCLDGNGGPIRFRIQHSIPTLWQVESNETISPRNYEMTSPRYNMSETFTIV